MRNNYRVGFILVLYKPKIRENDTQPKEDKRLVKAELSFWYRQNVCILAL